jgi:hypothetical protein
MFELEILAIRYVFSCTCLGGVAPPFHFGVYVSGHFKDLTEGAFLPPLRSPSKNMREPRSPPLLSH